jgi:hypothetical protein
MSKPGRYSKATVAAKLAALDEPAASVVALPSPPPVATFSEPAPQIAERETLPPLSAVPILERVKFRDHARTGSDRKPVREIAANQALLVQTDLGVMIDGRIFVPWSNIYWLEYR